MKTTDFVIIVAAGTGSRIGGDIPKQFRLLEGRPVLMHTLEKFNQCQTQPTIILVLSASMMDYWTALCDRHHFNVLHRVCEGGTSRFQSVQHGLKDIEKISELKTGSRVAVHDGARPLVSTGLIDSLFNACNTERPAVIPAVQSSNSIRLGSQEENQATDRNQVWLVQTPQVFDLISLKQAYQQPEQPSFTDDASVFETFNKKLYLYPGEHQNIKITREEDIAIVQQLIARQPSNNPS